MKSIIGKTLYVCIALILVWVLLMQTGAVQPASAAGLDQEVALTLTSLSRTSVKVYARPIKLVLEGTGFVKESVVLWGTTELTPIKGNATMLQVRITSDLISTMGTVDVAVKNPGDVISNALTFNVDAPKPQIRKLNPRKVFAESNGTGTSFEVKIFGRNFLADSTINWYDPVTLTTTPLTRVGDCTRTSCTASVDKGLISQKTNPKIYVVNGSVSSNGKTLNVMIPKPALTGMDPSTAIAGSGPVTLALTGSNFLSTAIVTWNGVALAGPVTWVDSQNLSVDVPAESLAVAGTFNVKVVNPGARPTRALKFKVTPVAGP